MNDWIKNKLTATEELGDFGVSFEEYFKNTDYQIALLEHYLETPLMLLQASINEIKDQLAQLYLSLPENDERRINFIAETLGSK